ncbi:MAG: Bifunctional protein FolD protein [Firmicutes bacterium]|nr:Bifunctional protein FolD protein [Bacillota bacterium]MBT9152088.1 Bifunctional protein FolD protein [Bacillota bacterium]MBT9157172.1 Bifunctional protein FolD protein [Bacillota bacterium]
MAMIIDGKALAKSIREDITKEIGTLNYQPTLAVVLVGTDPASATYVSMKEKACLEVGIASQAHRLAADVSQRELMMLITRLNADPAVNGILVQIPLPRQLDQTAIFGAIRRDKDVDGFHPMNVGLLNLGLSGALLPCTPAGVMEMLQSINYRLKGKHVVVVGRSNVVGKPMSTLFLLADATVTICHRYTENLGLYTRQADVLVVAVGKTNLITGDMVKPGAVVIDVGTNRVGSKLVGDVVYEDVKEVAAYITPVPGGVGPMTIAMLLKNTLLAAKMQHA